MAARLAIAVQLMLESRRVRLPRRGALYGVRAEARRTRHEGVKSRGPCPPAPAMGCYEASNRIAVLVFQTPSSVSHDQG